MKMAKRIAGLPPAAVRFAKKGINLAAESSVAAGLLFEQAQSTFCCGTWDQNEAINAFFGKRKPEFKGE
jgi:enoyl-CoA hydratase